MSARRQLGATSLAAIVGTALVPKCPLCVAAALSALGLGAAIAQRIAPFVRTLGFAIGAAAVVTLMVLEWRRRRGAACARCASAHRQGA
jgi:hypothetical protein